MQSFPNMQQLARDIRTRLRFGTFNERIDAARDISRYPEVLPYLLDELLDYYREGKVATGTMIDLLEKTHERRILEAILEKEDMEHAAKLGDWSAIVCFRCGAGHLESGLLEYLWRNKDRPDWVRREVVHALAEAGTQESLEVLDTLAGYVQADIGKRRAQMMKVSESGAAIIAAFELQAQEQFLQEIDDARERLRQRLA